MHTKQTLIALLLGVACATSAQAECLSDAQADDLAAHYFARTPAANLEGLSDADGACTSSSVSPGQVAVASAIWSTAASVTWDPSARNPATTAAKSPTGSTGTTMSTAGT